jgi:hypothetical protein
MPAEYYTPEPDATPEQRFIRLSIERAEATDRPITDEACRIIAGQLHGGAVTSMYSLASCGAIDQAGLSREIAIDVSNVYTADELVLLYEHIWRYAAVHGNRGPVKGWSQLTHDERIARLIIELSTEHHRE